MPLETRTQARGLLSEGRFLKLIGVGLAFAVLIDAVVIRSVLVPSVMQLFGTRAWWLPNRLERILPRLAVEPALDKPHPRSDRHPTPEPPP